MIMVDYNQRPDILMHCWRYENMIFEALNKGDKVEGYKLVQSLKNRAWDKDTIEESMKKLSRYLTKGVAMPSKPITPTQAKKLLTDKQYDVIKTYITREEGNITLTNSEDKRGAFNPMSIIDEF